MSVNVAESADSCLCLAGRMTSCPIRAVDPGNWATDIAAGSAYGYKLLITVLLANWLAIFYQALALKLGVVAERDLAQCCRDAYPRWANYSLWVMMEVK